MKARSRFSSIPTRPSEQGEETGPGGRWSCEDCLRELRRLGSQKNVNGMARFGIVAKKVWGVAKPKMDKMAKRVGRNHDLALALWKTGVHDARILAGMVADPMLLTARQMEDWVRTFDNWDICDGTSCHLFVFAPAAWEKAMEWAARRREFEKRAGFALMAFLAYRDRSSPDRKFRTCLRVIARECEDQRHFVKKAVNWALRNIGKRNLALNREAIRTAEEIRESESSSARWIAADALRELRSAAVQRRLRKRKA